MKAQLFSSKLTPIKCNKVCDAIKTCDFAQHVCIIYSCEVLDSKGKRLTIFQVYIYLRSWTWHRSNLTFTFLLQQIRKVVLPLTYFLFLINHETMNLYYGRRIFIQKILSRTLNGSLIDQMPFVESCIRTCIHAYMYDLILLRVTNAMIGRKNMEFVGTDICPL